MELALSWLTPELPNIILDGFLSYSAFILKSLRPSVAFRLSIESLMVSKSMRKGFPNHVLTLTLFQD